MRVSSTLDETVGVETLYESECVTFLLTVPAGMGGKVGLELTPEDLLDLIRQHQSACDDVIAELEAQLVLQRNPETDPLGE